MGLGDALLFRVGLDMGPVEKGLRGLRGRLNDTMGSSLAQAAGFAALTAGAAAFGKGVIVAGAEMETFESRLSTLMGSSSEAKVRLDELFQFAATTPFNTSQVVAAEVTLRGFGAAAVELMPGLIDFAAVTGTDLPQAAIDFGKAWNTGAVGLESDGGKILRKQIEIRSGMNAASMSIEEFRQTMLETLDEGMFAGGADRLSRTFSGMISNLQDEWAGFQREVAKAGVFNEAKALLAGILELIGDNREAAKGWARVLSDGVWFAIKGIGFTAAGVSDMFSGWGLLFATAKAGLWDLVAAELEMVRAAAQVQLGIARWTGDADMAADAVTRMNEAIAGRGAARQLASDAEDMLISLSAAPSAMQSFADLVDEAHRNAGGLADEIERATGGGPAKASAGKGGDDGFGKGWEAEIAAQEALLASGRAFAAEMMSLDDTRTEAAIANMDERLAANQAFFMAEAIGFQEALDLETAIRADASLQIGIIEAEEEARRVQAHEDELKRIEDEKKARMEATATAFGYVADIVGGIGALLDAENQKAKAAHKAFAITSIIIDAAAAGIRAFAELGPIAGAAASVAIGLDAAAAIVTVAKQHQGGVTYAHQGRYGDEYDSGNVRRLRQEGTLNSQTTRQLGEQGISALNGGAGLTATLNLTVGRTAQTEIIRTGLASGGPLQSAMRSSPSSPDRDVGFSGARAVA